MRRNNRLTALGAACAALCFLWSGCGRSLLGVRCGPGDRDVDLTGPWLDGEKAELVRFDFEQEGGAMASTRAELRICDHQDGQGTTSQSRADFDGDFVGCEFRGRITMCRFGHSQDPSLNGLVRFDFTAKLNFNQDRLEANEIFDPVTKATNRPVWVRLGCEPRPPEDFLLPGGEVIEFVARYDLAHGKITYVGEPHTQIDSVRRVVAGVTGTVQGGSRNSDGSVTVGVRLDNGKKLWLRMFGAFSHSSVSDGDAVDPSTEIGRIGRGQFDTFKLELVATGLHANILINPDCVEH